MKLFSSISSKFLSLTFCLIVLCSCTTENRVNLDYLDLKGNTAYHEEELFTGIGYSTFESGIDKLTIKYINGVASDVREYDEEKNLIKEVNFENFSLQRYMNRESVDCISHLIKLNKKDKRFRFYQLNKKGDTIQSLSLVKSNDHDFYPEGIKYFRLGKIWISCQYDQNTLRCLEYYENGQLKTKLNILRNAKHCPSEISNPDSLFFSNPVILQLPNYKLVVPNLSKAVEDVINYVNDKIRTQTLLSGTFESYFQNGLLKQKCFYTEFGQIQGENYFSREDGTASFITNFDNNNPNGFFFIKQSENDMNLIWDSKGLILYDISGDKTFYNIKVYIRNRDQIEIDVPTNAAYEADFIPSWYDAYRNEHNSFTMKKEYKYPSQRDVTNFIGRFGRFEDDGFEDDCFVYRSNDKFYQGINESNSDWFDHGLKSPGLSYRWFEKTIGIKEGVPNHIKLMFKNSFKKYESSPPQ